MAATYNIPKSLQVRALLLTKVAAASFACYIGRKVAVAMYSAREQRKNRRLLETVLRESDTLPMQHLDDGYDLIGENDQVPPIDVPAQAEDAQELNNDNALVEHDPRRVEDDPVGAVIVGQRMPNMIAFNMEVDNTPIQERRHRRLPHRRGAMRYARDIVAEIKCRLGTPKPTPANRMVVQRLARNLCETHGLRPTHAAKVIPMVVSAVFVPNDYEIEASEVFNCMESRVRRGSHVSLTTRVVHYLTGSLSRWTLPSREVGMTQ